MGNQQSTIWADAAACATIEELRDLLAGRLSELRATCETSQEYERLPHWGELTPVVGDLIGSGGERDLLTWDTNDDRPGGHRYLMVDWPSWDVYIMTEGERRERLQPPADIVETDLADITREQLEELTYGLAANGWTEYAERLMALNPVLGAYERLRAAAADANSPAPCDLARHVWDDLQDLIAADIDTPEAARADWMERYGRVD